MMVLVKILGSFGKVHGGIPVPSGSFPTMDPGFSNPMQFGGSNHTTGKGLEHDEGGSNKLADAGKLAQVFNLSFPCLFVLKISSLM